MTRPSPEELLAEAAQLAYHYHWPLDTILDLEHGDRRRFLRAAEEMSGPPGPEESWPGEQQQAIDELWE
jgi:hypothetical protein